MDSDISVQHQVHGEKGGGRIREKAAEAGCLGH